MVLQQDGDDMALSYDKLWNMLQQKNITKTEFRKMIEISSGTLAKMTSGEPVSLSIVERICEKFQCDISELLEYKHEKQKRLWKHIDENGCYHVELYYLYDPQWRTKAFSGVQFLYGYAIRSEEGISHERQIFLERKQSKEVYTIVGFSHNVSGGELIALLSVLLSGSSLSEFLSKFDYEFAGFDESEPALQKMVWQQQTVRQEPCVKRPEFMLTAQKNLDSGRKNGNVLSIIGKDHMYCESIIHLDKAQLYQDVTGECNISKMELIKEFVAGMDTLSNPETDIMRIGDFEVLSPVSEKVSFDELCEVNTIVEEENNHKKYIKGLEIQVFAAHLKGEYTLEIIAYNQYSPIAHRLYDFVMDKTDLRYTLELDESCSSVRFLLFSKEKGARFQLMGERFHYIFREISISFGSQPSADKLHKDYKKIASLHGVIMKQRTLHRGNYNSLASLEGNDPWRDCDNQVFEQFHELYQRADTDSFFTAKKEWESEFFSWIRKHAEASYVTNLWMTIGECSLNFISSLDNIARTAHIHISALVNAKKCSQDMREKWEQIGKSKDAQMECGVTPMLIEFPLYKNLENFIIIYKGRMVPDTYMVSDYTNTPLTVSKVSTDTSRQIVAYLFQIIQESEKNNGIAYLISKTSEEISEEVSGDMGMDSEDMLLEEIVAEINDMQENATKHILLLENQKIVFQASKEEVCKVLYKAFLKDFHKYSVIYGYCLSSDKNSLKEYCVKHYDIQLSDILCQCLNNEKVSVSRVERKELSKVVLGNEHSFDGVYQYVSRLYGDIFPRFYISGAASLAHTIMCEADMVQYIRLLENIYDNKDALRFVAFLQRLVLHLSYMKEKNAWLAADQCLHSPVNYICAIGIYYYVAHYNMQCGKLEHGSGIISKEEYRQKLLKECVITAQIKRLRSQEKKDEEFEQRFTTLKELWGEQCSITKTSGWREIFVMLDGLEQRSFQDVYDMIEILEEKEKVSTEALSEYIINLVLQKVRQDYKKENGFYYFDDFQNGDILLCALYNFSTKKWAAQFLKELAQMEKQFISALHDVFLKEKNYRKWSTFMDALLWCRCMRKWWLQNSDNYEELVKDDTNRNVRIREVAGLVKKYKKDLEGYSKAYHVWSKTVRDESGL